MSLETIKQALPALWLQVQGVKNALPEAPNSLTGIDLPLALCFPGNAQYSKSKLGNNFIVENRTWRMRLYVAPAMSGVPGEAESLPEPYFVRVQEFFNARPTLGGIVGMQNALLTADSGTIVLRYNNGGQVDQYIGIEFTMTTEEIYRRTFASGE
jgi:hypothetical protein